MINTEYFYKLLVEFGIGFFSGVPDSLLKNICFCITDKTDKKNHITAVNEGAAIALAAGYHLAAEKIPLVYMQNSGLGNAVNPLLSLADKDVYGIPIVLLIGWRGEPGVKDEPQHLKQGEVTCSVLDAMNIPYLILSDNEHDVKDQLNECFTIIKKNSTPFAFIVRKDTFSPYIPSLKNNAELDKGLISREEAIEYIIKTSSPSEVFISTTGMASRELYDLREKYQTSHERDFLTVGSMGYASSIALAVAMRKPKLRVTCIDGDGAALMHMGSIAAIGVQKPANLRHIVLNNGAHDSVGGQPTIAQSIDLCGIARSSGYAQIFSVKNLKELQRALDETLLNENLGAVFIEVQIRKGNRKDLGRPASSPKDNKEAFMRFISEMK